MQSSPRYDKKRRVEPCINGIVVRLSDSEREILSGLIVKRDVSAQRVLRARVLLKVDADGPSWTDAELDFVRFSTARVP